MRVVRVFVSLVIALAALPPVPAHAAPARARWVTHGPFGGIATGFAQHPTKPGVVLSGSLGGGLFRSTDGGRTWSRRRGVPRTAWVTAVAFAASKPSLAFATAGNTVFKSTDGGRTWARLTEDAGYELSAIAVHPKKPGVLFVGGEDSTTRSTDGGKTWEEVLFHSHDHFGDPGRTIAIAPSRPRVVYTAGLYGLMVSRDGGDTWEPGGGGEPTGYEVVVHPRKPSTVYVGGGYGVAKSVDGGRTFRRVWEAAEDDYVITLAIDRVRPSRLYTGTRVGVFRLTRGGKRATAWDRGISRPSAAALGVLRDGSVLAGVARRGIYRRAAGAARWRPSRHGFINTAVHTVANAPSDGSVVYSGVSDMGVAVSTDSGRTWRWRGLGRRSVWALAVHPRQSEVVYAATDRGVFRTDDGGRRWRRMLRGRITDVAVAASNPGVIYASGPVTGLFRSTDRGATWTKSSLDPASEVIAVTVDPTRPATVFAGTRNDSVVKSVDGGATWTTGEGLVAGAEAEDIAIDPSRPERVFASISRVGILRSVDGGATWQHMTGGTPPQGGNAVIIDPRRPRRVYAAVGNGWADWIEGWGVFRSDDGGRTWQAMGLTRYEIGAIALGGKGSVLYAGTGGVLGHVGAGVFTRRVE